MATITIPLSSFDDHRAHFELTYDSVTLKISSLVFSGLGVRTATARVVTGSGTTILEKTNFTTNRTIAINAPSFKVEIDGGGEATIPAIVEFGY